MAIEYTAQQILETTEYEHKIMTAHQCFKLPPKQMHELIVEPRLCIFKRDSAFISEFIGTVGYDDDIMHWFTCGEDFIGGSYDINAYVHRIINNFNANDIVFPFMAEFDFAGQETHINVETVKVLLDDIPEEARYNNELFAAIERALEAADDAGAEYLLIKPQVLSNVPVTGHGGSAVEQLPLTMIYTSDEEHGTIVQVGDKLTLDGETVTVTDLIPPHKPASSGFVQVRHENGFTMRYYPSVIGAEWINRTDR